MSKKNKYVLNLSCKDTKGIVAAVSGFLTFNDGFIIESAQFGDPSTKRFFMRTVFEAPATDEAYTKIIKNFQAVAKKFKMQWQLHDTNKKSNVLIMVSKLSHCLNDLLYRYSSGHLNIEIPAIVSNHPDLEHMAKWHNIPFYHLPIAKDNKEKQERQIVKLINEHNIDLVVLARYMQILSGPFAKKLAGKAINIHHSFLPSFKGAKPYHQAYDKGVKIIGATAHYVNDKLDEGPIIEQEVIRIDHTNTPDQMVALGHDIERVVLAKAVKYHIENRIILNGNKTVIFK